VSVFRACIITTYTLLLGCARFPFLPIHGAATPSPLTRCWHCTRLPLAALAWSLPHHKHAVHLPLAAHAWRSYNISDLQWNDDHTSNVENKYGYRSVSSSCVSPLSALNSLASRLRASRACRCWCVVSVCSCQHRRHHHLIPPPPPGRVSPSPQRQTMAKR
jgi:hypothetical protein